MQYWPGTVQFGSMMVLASQVCRPATGAFVAEPMFPRTKSFIGTNVEKLWPIDRPRACLHLTVTAVIFFRFPWTVGSPVSRANVWSWGVKARPTVTWLALGMLVRPVVPP